MMIMSQHLNRDTNVTGKIDTIPVWAHDRKEALESGRFQNVDMWMLRRHVSTQTHMQSPFTLFTLSNWLSLVTHIYLFLHTHPCVSTFVAQLWFKNEDLDMYPLFVQWCSS